MLLLEDSSYKFAEFYSMLSSYRGGRMVNQLIRYTMIKVTLEVEAI